MSAPQQSQPHVLDAPWRVWASAAVIGIVLAGAVLGVLVIPIVQGRGAGLDAYTAICRALGLLPGSPAQPQPVDRTPPTPVSQVVWTPQVLAILAAANTERGRAKVMEVCVACHGEQGVSTDPQYPNLNGQSGAAIYKQLHDYRTGSRAHPLMTPVAQALDEAVIADVAAYYAGQPKRNPNPATLGELPANIVRLVELGDPDRNIPPCMACHRPGSGTTYTGACGWLRRGSRRRRSRASPATIAPAFAEHRRAVHAKPRGLSAVMRGLDPRIHLLRITLFAKKMDCRVTGPPAAQARRGPRPGNDERRVSEHADRHQAGLGSGVATRVCLATLAVQMTATSSIATT
jgi:cytochrome c553